MTTTSFSCAYSLCFKCETLQDSRWQMLSRMSRIHCICLKD